MPRKTKRPDPWRSASVREGKFSPTSFFTRSLVLMVANDLGAFECLSGGPLSLDEIVAKLKTNPKGTRILLDALVVLRYLGKSNGHYVNEPDTARYLTKKSPDYVGAMLSHSYHGLSRWLRLEDLVRKGQKHKHKLPEFQVPAEAERRSMKRFTLGLDQSSRATASLVADMLEMDGVVEMLDIGGGAGAYSIALAKKWRSLKPVIFELPVPARVARAQVKAARLGKRIGVKTGDFMKDDLGRDAYDAVFVSNIIHIYPPAENKEIVRKIHRALRSGGKIIIKDMMVNDGRAGPFYPVMFALTMLMFTDNGDTYTFSDVKDWLKDAGFKRIRRRVVIPQESYLLMGEKE